jgi:hypothetical protein
VTLIDFLSGCVTMGFFTCALFFLRFWSRTRDPLFLSFAVAFCLLGVAQALLSLTGIPAEERSYLYLIRLTAFLLIIVAIWHKNWPAKPQR